MSINVESGLRNIRCEFIRESAYGDTPANPDWELFSDEVFQATWAGSVDIFEKRALGAVDPQEFFGGPESHQLTIEYYLQRWIMQAGPLPLDPLGDAITRDADNNLPNSLAICIREERQVSGGSVDSGERVYTVANGCYAGDITIPGNVESGEPIRPNVVYTASKVRSYAISQPSASTTLSAVSTSTDDTTQTLTVESDGEPATASEGIALNGTTPVVTTASFTTIDAAFLDGECVGDVTVSDGTTDLFTIYGSGSYDDTEGDLGVPNLGTGSHGAALSVPYEQFIDDTIERPAATNLATYINSAEFRVSNNLEVFPQLGTRKQIIVPGIRNVELSATVFGPSESHAQIMDHLRTLENNIVWTLTGGTITLTSAVLRDPPQRQYTAEEVTMSLDSVFVGKGLAVSNP